MKSEVEDTRRKKEPAATEVAPELAEATETTEATPEPTEKDGFLPCRELM